MYTILLNEYFYFKIFIFFYWLIISFSYFSFTLSVPLFRHCFLLTKSKKNKICSIFVTAPERLQGPDKTCKSAINPTYYFKIFPSVFLNCIYFWSMILISSSTSKQNKNLNFVWHKTPRGWLELGLKQNERFLNKNPWVWMYIWEYLQL